MKGERGEAAVILNDWDDLSMTEAHGGASSLESRSSSGTSSSSGSGCSQSTTDDDVAMDTRQRIREHRGALIGHLAEKMSSPLLHALLMVQVVSPQEADQVKRKQRRQQKASCLLDIVSRKTSTELKIFVDTLRTHCPKAHSLLFVPEQSPSSLYSILQQQDAPSTNRNVNGAAGRDARSPIDVIEKRHKRASSQLKKCLDDHHYGMHAFLRELQSVVRSGIDISLLTFDKGLTLIHEAINSDQVDSLRAIQYAGVWKKLYNLRSGVQCGALSRLTPLEYATKVKPGKMLETLVSINRAEQALQEIDICARKGDVARFREIKGRDKRHIQSGVIRGSGSVLEFACQSGVLPMVLDVIKAEQELGCRRTSVGKAVALCVDLGHYLLLQPILEYVSVSASNVTVEGKSLTERAAVNGDFDTFLELERLGVTPAETVLALSAAQNRLPFLRELLNGRRRSLNLNFQDRRKKSAAHFSAEKGHAEVVRLLLDKGLDLSLKDKRNFTILHAAANGGSADTIQVVLDACRQQNLLQSMIKARDLYLGAERCFLVRGRDNEQPAWHYVEADRARIDIFRKRTQGGAVDVAAYGVVLRSGWGNAPSETVIQEVEGVYDVVNAKPNSPPDMQPIHVALLKGHEEAALKFIEIMDDIGQPDRFGLTPLHMAAMRGLTRAIEALLEKGADRRVVDDQGRTALDIAKANDHRGATILLTPNPEQDETEALRRKLLDAYQKLSREKIHEQRVNDRDPKLYMKALLRDVIADVNDFLYDSLGEGPIAAESGEQSLTGNHM